MSTQVADVVPDTVKDGLGEVTWKEVAGVGGGTYDMLDLELVSRGGVGGAALNGKNACALTIGR